MFVELGLRGLGLGMRYGAAVEPRLGHWTNLKGHGAEVDRVISLAPDPSPRNPKTLNPA